MNTTSQTAPSIEALLFAAAEPLAYARLKTMLSIDDAVLNQALREIESRLTGGIRMVRTDVAVGLATAPEAAEVVSQLLGDPGEREIGQAGLEVLAIIIYQGPSTKATIDYIRGVNSSSTIRTLTYRGLLERVRAQDNVREIRYQPTPELLAHLGVTRAGELPDFETLHTELVSFLECSEKEKET